MKVRFLERHSRIKEALRWLAAITIVVGSILLVLFLPAEFWGTWPGPIVPCPEWTEMPMIGGIGG